MALADLFWVALVAAISSFVLTACALWKYGVRGPWLQSFAATALAAIPGVGLVVEFTARCVLYLFWDVTPVNDYEFFSVPVLLFSLPVGAVLLFMAALGARWSRPGVVGAVQLAHVASWALSVFAGVLMARLF